MEERAMTPAGLLADLGTLRHRARADRRATSVPLLAFGTVVAASAALPHHPIDFLFWMVAIPLTTIAVAAWYRRHEVRSGTGSRTRTWAGASVAVVVLLVVLPGSLALILGLHLAVIGAVVATMGAVQRTRSLVVAGLLVGVLGGLEGSYLISNRLPRLDGWSDGVWPDGHHLVVLALGLGMVAAGLTAWRRERV
jgi:hypothetical protein